MKREAILRALRRYARKHGVAIEIDHGGGKGSHNRVRLGEAVTTIQRGELSPFHIDRICRQLDIDRAAL